MKQPMKKHISGFITYMILFLILVGLELGMQLIVAWIPTERIQANMEISAAYLCENPLFYNVHEKDKSTRIDHYADSILLNVLYCYDKDAPLKSVMYSGYYYEKSVNENSNLKTAVTENKEPTVDYMRYWHGSISLLRPLFTVLHLKQIYILNGILLLLFLALLLFQIFRYLGKGAGIAFILALIFNNVWFVPFSLEYTFMFMLMLISSNLLFYLHRKNSALIPVLFFITGSLAAYFDFLTTETITLTIPLILWLLLEEKTGSITTLKDGIIKCIKAGALWLIAFVLTWASKWLLASLVLGENAFTNAFSHASLRMQGEAGISDVTGINLILGSLLRNLDCLFPFSLVEQNGYLLALGTLVLCSIIYYLIKNQKTTTPIVPLLMLIGCIPYLRYTVLSNHSYIHCFFTFRAQLITIFCIGLLFVYNTDTAFLQKEWKKLWKKKSKKRK